MVTQHSRDSSKAGSRYQWKSEIGIFKESVAGIPTNAHQYDSLGNLTLTCQDLDLDGEIDLASPDP
jgi:hypothetical protein